MRRLINHKDYDLEEYWDSAQIKAGYNGGVTKTSTINIPPRSFIQDVIALVAKPVMTSGTCTIIVGDAIDDDGILLSQDVANIIPNTAFGQDVDYIGDYLLENQGAPLSTSEQVDTDARTAKDYERHGKWYPNGGTVVVTMTGGAGTITFEGDVMVWVKIISLKVGD